MSGGLPGRAAAAESLLEHFFEQSPDAILIADKSGTIVRVNVELERSFGYTRTELLGQPVEVLIPERFRLSHPEHRRAYGERPKRRPMGAGLELFARRKDGSDFPVDIMLSPINAPAGGFALCAIRDISERRLAQATLEATEQSFRFFVENVQDYAIFQLDPDGRIRTWNAGAERMKGYSAEEIVGVIFPVSTLRRTAQAASRNSNSKPPQRRDAARMKVGDCAKTARVSGATSPSPRSAIPAECCSGS